MRREWGVPPWRRAPLSAAPASNATPDVAIIGAGLTGLSTAYHLARQKIRAVVFEASEAGDGASGRTGGIVLEGTAVGALDEVSDCVGGLERIVEQEQIDCELKLPGCWEIEHQQGDAGRALPWSDNGRVVSIARTVRGGVVQPAALVAGLARAAIRAGAIIRERTPAARLLLAPQPAIEVSGETIRPGYVVIAANAWISALVPDAPALSSSLTYACATEPLDAAAIAELGLAEGIPFYTADLPYLWGRTTADARVIFGSGLVFGAPAELEDLDADAGESRAMLDRLEQRVRGLHPRLRSVAITARWGGPIAFTEDGVPILGPHPRCDRVLVAGGYAGHGVALSVRVGELLALAISQGRALPKWGGLDR
jgi:gamma-glutamylputrescine oxidase